MDKYLIIKPSTLLIPDFSAYDFMDNQHDATHEITNLCLDKDSELSEMTCR